MAARDALGRQFAKHAHPLGGPGGIEDRLRSRASWEEGQAKTDPGVLHQMTRVDHGAAMAMVEHYRPPWWD